MTTSFKKPSKIDVAYVTAVALPVIVLAIFTVLGSSFAAHTLSFVVGTLLGYLVARLMTITGGPKWVQATALFFAALAIVTAVMVVVLPLANPDLLGAFGWFRGADAWYGLLIGGFAFLFFTEIFRRVALPSLYPSTHRENQQCKREQLRDIFVVGSLLLVMVAGLVILYVILTLISQGIVYFLE